MTPLAVFQQLHALNVALTPWPDGTLHYDAPEGVITEEIMAQMRQHKTALLDYVEAYEERAGIAEYCGGLSRLEAEAVAWAPYTPVPPRGCWPHNPLKMAGGWRCTRCNHPYMSAPL